MRVTVERDNGNQVCSNFALVHAKRRVVQVTPGRDHPSRGGGVIWPARPGIIPGPVSNASGNLNSTNCTGPGARVTS